VKNWIFGGPQTKTEINIPDARPDCVRLGVGQNGLPTKTVFRIPFDEDGRVSSRNCGRLIVFDAGGAELANHQNVLGRRNARQDEVRFKRVEGDRSVPKASLS